MVYTKDLPYNPKSSVSPAKIEEFFSVIRDGNLPELTKYVIDNKISGNIMSRSKKHGSEGYGKTPIHVILEVDNKIVDKYGKLQIVKYLDSIGAPLDLPDETGTYPIHLAISQQIPKLVSYFIDRHVSLDRKDNLGNTPLHYSIYGKLVNNPDFDNNKIINNVPEKDVREVHFNNDRIRLEQVIFDELNSQKYSGSLEKIKSMILNYPNDDVVAKKGDGILPDILKPAIEDALDFNNVNDGLELKLRSKIDKMVSSIETIFTDHVITNFDRGLDIGADNVVDGQSMKSDEQIMDSVKDRTPVPPYNEVLKSTSGANRAIGDPGGYKKMYTDFRMDRTNGDVYRTVFALLSRYYYRMRVVPSIFARLIMDNMHVPFFRLHAEYMGNAANRVPVHYTFVDPQNIVNSTTVAISAYDDNIPDSAKIDKVWGSITANLATGDEKTEDLFSSISRKIGEYVSVQGPHKTIIANETVLGKPIEEMMRLPEFQEEKIKAGYEEHIRPLVNAKDTWTDILLKLVQKTNPYYGVVIVDDNNVFTKYRNIFAGKKSDIDAVVLPRTPLPYTKDITNLGSASTITDAFVYQPGKGTDWTYYDLMRIIYMAQLGFAYNGELVQERPALPQTLHGPKVGPYPIRENGNDNIVDPHILEYSFSGEMPFAGVTGAEFFDVDGMDKKVDDVWKNSLRKHMEGRTHQYANAVEINQDPDRVPGTHLIATVVTYAGLLEMVISIATENYTDVNHKNAVEKAMKKNVYLQSVIDFMTYLRAFQPYMKFRNEMKDYNIMFKILVRAFRKSLISDFAKVISSSIGDSASFQKLTRLYLYKSLIGLGRAQNVKSNMDISDFEIQDSDRILEYFSTKNNKDFMNLVKNSGLNFEVLSKKNIDRIMSGSILYESVNDFLDNSFVSAADAHVNRDKLWELHLDNYDGIAGHGSSAPIRNLSPEFLLYNLLINDFKNADYGKRVIRECNVIINDLRNSEYSLDALATTQYPNLVRCMVAIYIFKSIIQHYVEYALKLGNLPEDIKRYFERRFNNISLIEAYYEALASVVQVCYESLDFLNVFNKIAYKERYFDGNLSIEIPDFGVLDEIDDTVTLDTMKLAAHDIADNFYQNYKYPSVSYIDLSYAGAVVVPSEGTVYNLLADGETTNGTYVLGKKRLDPHIDNFVPENPDFFSATILLQKRQVIDRFINDLFSGAIAPSSNAIEIRNILGNLNGAKLIRNTVHVEDIVVAEILNSGINSIAKHSARAKSMEILRDYVKSNAPPDSNVSKMIDTIKNAETTPLLPAPGSAVTKKVAGINTAQIEMEPGKLKYTSGESDDSLEPIRKLYGFAYSSGTLDSNNVGYEKSVKITRKLITVKNINSRNIAGQTPLHVAFMTFDHQLAEELIAKGALIDSYPNNKNQTPRKLLLISLCANMKVKINDSISNSIESIVVPINDTLMNKLKSSTTENNIIKDITFAAPILLIMYNHLFLSHLKNYRHGFSYKISEAISSIINARTNENISYFPFDLFELSRDELAAAAQVDNTIVGSRRSAAKYNSADVDSTRKKLTDAKIQLQGIEDEIADHPDRAADLDGMKTNMENKIQSYEDFLANIDKNTSIDLSPSIITSYQSKIMGIKSFQRELDITDFYRKAFDQLGSTKDFKMSFWKSYIEKKLGMAPSMIFSVLETIITEYIGKASNDQITVSIREAINIISDFYKIAADYINSKDYSMKYLSSSTLTDASDNPIAVDLDMIEYLINTIITPGISIIIKKHAVDTISNSMAAPLPSIEILTKIEEANINNITLDIYLRDHLPKKYVRMIANIYDNEKDPNRKSSTIEKILGPIINILSSTSIVGISSDSKVINDIKTYIFPFIENTYGDFIQQMRVVIYGYEMHVMNTYNSVKLLQLIV